MQQNKFRFASALAVGLSLAGFAHSSCAAEPPKAELKQVEQDLGKERQRQKELKAESQRLDREAKDLQAQLVEAANALRTSEEELNQLEADIVQIAAEEEEQTRVLLSNRQNLSDLLVTLQRLSRVPPEAVLARQNAPTDLLRSALLLRSAVPLLRERAAELAQGLERLASLREGLAQQREASTLAQAELQQKQADFTKLLEERQAALQETEAQRTATEAAVQKLATRASSLRDLIRRIETEQAEAARKEQQAQTASIAAAPAPGLGSFRFPATGAVTVSYGVKTAPDGQDRGVHIAARPSSVVVAPFGGQVRFAGTFRSYGQILIVEHADGYHSLISGLGQIHAKAGQKVTAGEPLGAMPSSNRKENRLYYELRRNGIPVDPKTFAAISKGQG